MRIQIVAHTPHKYLESKPQECTRVEYERLLTLLKGGEMEYFTIETDSGIAILNRDVLKNTILGISVLKDTL